MLLLYHFRRKQRANNNLGYQDVVLQNHRPRRRVYTF